MAPTKPINGPSFGTAIATPPIAQMIPERIRIYVMTLNRHFVTYFAPQYVH